MDRNFLLGTLLQIQPGIIAYETHVEKHNDTSRAALFFLSRLFACAIAAAAANQPPRRDYMYFLLDYLFFMIDRLCTYTHTPIYLQYLQYLHYY